MPIPIRTVTNMFLYFKAMGRVIREVIKRGFDRLIFILSSAIMMLEKNRADRIAAGI